MGLGEGRYLSAMLWFVPASAPLRAVAGVLQRCGVGPSHLCGVRGFRPSHARRNNPYERPARPALTRFVQHPEGRAFYV